MATLTLKKPKLVRDAKPEDLDGKYAVMRRHLDSKTMKFTVVRDTIEDARKEAQRLSIECPDHQFAVVQFVDKIGGN